MTETERNTLVEQYLPLVKRTAYGLNRAYSLPKFINTDDLIQDASLRLLTAIEHYDGRNGACLDTFLHRVIRHDVLDAIDKQWRRDRFNLHGDVPTNGHHDKGMDQLRESWKQCLTRKQLQAVELVYIYGFTQEKAASKLGITKQSVNQSLSLAIKKLRKHT